MKVVDLNVIVPMRMSVEEVDSGCQKAALGYNCGGPFCQIGIYIYIYICACMCACVCVCVSI